MASSAGIEPGVVAHPRRRSSGLGRLGGASGLGLGVATIWLSILVLIPLAAVVAKSAGLGWHGFWSVITTPEVESALRLTVVEALLVTIVNIVMGTLVAWVLVRDDFVGRRVLEVVIDLPFALPTIVAGLVLLSLYGPSSPLHVNLAASRQGVFLALLFVTLPFVVRTVQPVLIELDRDMEEAAASLGASRFTTFRRIILPNLLPAISAGAALSFARALSEYGATVLISGNIPLKTEVASVAIINQIEGDHQAGAAAVATVLLVVALLVIVGLDLLQRLAARRG